ncbi:MAG: YraN family protein [Bacteroidetes bacterium]|nr:YraN family protein [Bacteroidota bacterium]
MINKQTSLDQRRKEFGIFCEKKACLYLSNHDYKIVEQRYRYKKGEIDIIAKKHNLLVFIEVKGRKNSNYGNSESFVDQTKEKIIIETAEAYIFLNDWNGDIRFDIIAIQGKFKNYKLLHFEDAFY